MKIALVTGADGFLGHCLCKHLIQRGYFVYGIGISENKIKDIDSVNFLFINAYFEDYKSLKNRITKKIDYFFHFAWNGVFGNAFKDYALQLSNAKYACDAVLIAKDLGCKKFILASTINTLETLDYFGKFDIEPRYTNIYAMSKLSAEMIGKTIAYQNEIEFNCGLISMVYGPSNYSLMVPNVVMLNLLQNKASNLIDYDTSYDLIYVEDVADAFISIAEKGINLKTYYVGHPSLQKFGDIFSNIKSIINDNGILNFGVFPNKTLINYNLIDLNSLYKDTGFLPSYDFRKSIRETAKWLQDNISCFANK